MTRATQPSAGLTPFQVDVIESGKRPRKGRLACEISTHVRFNTERMESYFFAQWEPVLYDALLLAAAIEFCDRSKKRPARGWSRNFELNVPVHEVERWNRPEVQLALHSALNFLTGDQWRVTFTSREQKVGAPRQTKFALPAGVEAVVPFSDGIDSRAVAALAAKDLADRLVRIHLGSKDLGATKGGGRQPFTSVPYDVTPGERAFAESTVRSRGFKFSLISGLAAFLSGAKRIIVPESGQGALGPVLATVGQGYPDYRNHPLFTERMEKFLAALLDFQVAYEFPRLWNTKGETLSAFARQDGPDAALGGTRSCWQQNRHVSVDHKARQCGICAACMLRRMSVHAAGLSEPSDTYVWDLSAASFDEGAAPSFDRRKITPAMRQHAIAGALHLDHLAGLRRSPANEHMLVLGAYQLARACKLSEPEARARLDRLLQQHEKEWTDFMGSLGSSSFVANWAAGAS